MLSSRINHNTVRAGVLLLLVLTGSCSPPRTSLPAASPPLEDPEVRIKTELYFGMLKADGSTISESEWQQFLDEEITPRFEEGCTVLDAYGQYLDRAGTLVREPSRILILIHPPTVTADSSIERIRSLYRERFDQESVLRVSTPAGVSF